jgi:hypothetical protein
MNTLGLLIEDLGGPLKVARLLDVHHSTVYRWRAGTLPIPRAHLRALQAASRWGRQDRAVMTLNHQATLHALVESQARRIAELEAQLARVVALADTGAANAPLWRMVRQR